MKKVLNAEPYGYSEKAVHLWQEGGFEYHNLPWSEIDLTPDFSDVSILIVRLKRYIDKNTLKKFPNLKYLVSATTGHDHIDIDYLNKHKIELVSLRGHNDFLKTIPSTAEHTWALLMALIRNIPSANEHVKSGNWDRDSFRGYQLKNKVLGIIGLGRTGTKVSEYASAFGMTVHYYDPFVKNESYVKEISLKSLMEVSDIVSIHVHLTNETEDLINAENVKFAKKNAIIINTSRGKVLEERAVADAIRNESLGGLATDVLATELDSVKKSELWKAQQEGRNVIITPHIGGATYDAMWACEEFIVKKVYEKNMDK